MDRPYVICHMLTSIDGKVTGDFLSHDYCEKAIDAYYQINRDLKADAFACGRVTMEDSFTNHKKVALSRYKSRKVPRVDFVAMKAKRYAVAFDRYGKLGWTSSTIIDEDPGYGGAHIIEVLLENVSDAYLAYLKTIKVSYIFAGKDEMDVSLALKKLKDLFGIKKLLLEGGSIIDGAFLKENLVDELSLVVTPIVADASSKPLFDAANMQTFSLLELKYLKDSSVYLRYKLTK